MKNILVLGYSGFLGQNFVNLICKNKKKYFLNYHKNKKKFQNFKYCNINLNSKNNIINFIKKNNIDIILNFSGFTNVSLCEIKKKEAKKVNFFFIKNIVDVIKNTKIKFIHISTDHFSYNNKLNSENDVAKPVNFYGKTKLMADNYIKKSLENFVILRTNFFGLEFAKKNYFLINVIKSLLKKKNIIGWNNIFFNPVHVKVLVEVVNSFMKKAEVNGVFNVSCNKKLTKYAFFKSVADILMLDNKLILKRDYNLDIKRPKYMTLSNKKLIKIFPTFKKKLSYNYQINTLKGEYKKLNV